MFIRQFGSRGSGEGELQEIWSIAVDKYNLVYVADIGNHCISIFTIEGQFVNDIKCKGLFELFSFLTVDMSGNLYVVDHENILAMF